MHPCLAHLLCSGNPFRLHYLPQPGDVRGVNRPHCRLCTRIAWLRFVCLPCSLIFVCTSAQFLKELWFGDRSRLIALGDGLSRELGVPFAPRRGSWTLSLK